MTVDPVPATTDSGMAGEAARGSAAGRARRTPSNHSVPALCDAIPTRPFERLWLSADELRMVADEVGPTVVVVTDLPVGLADMVKTRRRRQAAGFARRNGR